MEGKWQTWVGGAVLVGLGAAGAWTLKPDGRTSSPDAAHSAPAGAQDLAAAASEVAAPAAASAVDGPAEATWVAMVNPQAGPAGQFIPRGLEDGAKVLRMAEDAVGSPDQRASLKLATWKLVISGAQQRTAVVKADLTRGIVLKDEESGDELGWLDGTCWIARGPVVVPCMRPTASLIRALLWALRGVAVTSLAEPPWHMSAASTGKRDERLQNMLTFETDGAAQDSVGMLVAVADPTSRRLTGLEFSSGRTAKDDAASLLSRGRVDFEDPRPIGVWTLPSTSRISLIDQTTDELILRVVDVRTGAQLPKIAPVQFFPKGLVVGTRPAGLGLVFVAGSHDLFVPAINKATELLASPVKQVQFDVIEAFAPLGRDSGQDIELWMAPRSQVLLTAAGLSVHTKPLPAELAVVRKWVHVPYAQVPAEVANLLREAEQAGYKPAGGRRTTAIYLFNEEGPSPLVSVELALPIEAP